MAKKAKLLPPISPVVQGRVGSRSRESGGGRVGVGHGGSGGEVNGAGGCMHRVVSKGVCFR